MPSEAEITGTARRRPHAAPRNADDGVRLRPALSEGALKCPIFHTSTFVFENAEAGKAYFELAYGLREAGPARGSRPDLFPHQQPGPAGAGGAALHLGPGRIVPGLLQRHERHRTTLLTFLRPGDCIVHSEPVYGGTEYLLHKVLPQFGIKRIGFGRLDAELAAGRGGAEAGSGPLRMIYAETPANPTNALVDIARVRELRAPRRPGAEPLVVVDNTFLGPLWQQPLDHGADLVLYSLTKYVGGHSDLIAGACLGREADRAGARHAHHPRHHGRSDDRLAGDAVAGNAQAAHDVVHEERALRGGVPGDRTRRCERATTSDSWRRARQQEIYRRQCVAPGSTFSFEVTAARRRRSAC
jgi:cystathionine beta-lyase/cystathionine gamma-synthase